MIVFLFSILLNILFLIHFLLFVMLPVVHLRRGRCPIPGSW